MKTIHDPFLYLEKELEFIEDKYPHVYNNILLLWGYDEFNVYLSRILTDTRENTRKGFPFKHAEILFAIMQVHDELFPRKSIVDWKYP